MALHDRGLVYQSSAPLEKVLERPRTFYFGVDPSASSLHIGNLVGLMLAMHMVKEGHTPVLLIGGGTGLIGDPRQSGERPLLDARIAKKNAEGIRAQLASILKTKVRLVNNKDWLLRLNTIEFLRDVGKHFTVNALIKRDLIKTRLEKEDEPISFTEFSYGLLQAYDFYVINKKFGVDVQIGGSDQWANILGGVELIRKLRGKEVFALTTPIINDATGKKLGKSEGNAVWLNPTMTTPFQFYQYWFNLPDTVLKEYFGIFTFLEISDIDELLAHHAEAPHERLAQKRLAQEVTSFIHGDEKAREVATISEALFSDEGLLHLNATEKAALLREIPHTTYRAQDVEAGVPIVDALVATGLAASKGDARRTIESGGVSVGGIRATLDTQLGTAPLTLIKKGRRDIALVCVV